jgi:hypothetical protein
MLALLLALAVSGSCQTTVIDHYEDTPWMVSQTEVVEGLRSDIIGHFFVVEIDGEQQSYDLADKTINSVVACLDGTVTIEQDPVPVVRSQPRIVEELDWSLIE